MGKSKSEWLLYAFALFLVLALIGLSSNIYNLQLDITGRQSEQTTPSQAIVGKYVAISMSGNLSDGIDFGNITVLPAPDVNATMNYNSTVNQSSYANETLYWITLSLESNVNADFCVKSSNFNTSGGVQIELGNYTFEENATDNDFDNPAYADRVAMYVNNSYMKRTQVVVPGNDVYYRFWLNVTDYVQPGLYNSTVYFEGVPTGDPCS